MKLFEFAPTRSIRVRWTLQELEIDFDAVTVNLLTGEHRQPAFLKINPAGKVPALVDRSNAFPITVGALQTGLNGTEDAFVTKLNKDGSGLEYSTYLGGSANDAGYGIAVGANGYAYITGYTQSPDFPTTTDAIQTINPSGRTAFVTALDAKGARLAYSTYLGGSNGDGGYGIAVDSNGNAYVTGYTNSADFPTTAGASQTSLARGASRDAFVMKISFTNSEGH
jgi:Beta-propeller repeat/Glutathione S-transferase, N-terminal domain